MPLLWRSSRESRSERCKRAFLLAPICKVLLAPTLVSDRATRGHVESGENRGRKERKPNGEQRFRRKSRNDRNVFTRTRTRES